MPEHLIEGHHVTCTHNDHQQRVWHCGCADYEHRLLKFKEGFCAHTVVAIQRALAAGDITPPD